MFVLDTNIISELDRAVPDRRVVAWIDAQPTVFLFTTSITIAELHVGIELLPPSKRREQLARFAEAVLVDFEGRTLPFDAVDAPDFGEIVARRQRLGRPIDPQDAMIAAITRRRGMTLVTRNTRDFLDLGIDLVDPFVG